MAQTPNVFVPYKFIKNIQNAEYYCDYDVAQVDKIKFQLTQYRRNLVESTARMNNKVLVQRVRDEAKRKVENYNQMIRSLENDLINAEKKVVVSKQKVLNAINDRDLFVQSKSN